MNPKNMLMMLFALLLLVPVGMISAQTINEDHDAEIDLDDIIPDDDTVGSVAMGGDCDGAITTRVANDQVQYAGIQSGIAENQNHQHIHSYFSPWDNIADELGLR